jgi:alkylation response protein AidB-like acyl-CoA dehydrogenase
MSSAAKLRVSPPPGLPRDELIARIPALALEIAKDASRRDLDRELPFAAFRLFRQSGLGALRIPIELGGPGGSVADCIGLIETIAAADSNVAHALRSHFNFTEALVLSPEAPKARLGLERVLEGALFGGAHTEQGGPKAGLAVSTTLTKVGASYRLNGKKWYATGTAFADYASFSANTETGDFVSVLIPVARQGVTILDDWDGMGQRLTASGGVLLEDVEVFPQELSYRQLNDLAGRHTSTLRQLHLAACAAGIVRNVVTDATAYIQKQARAAAHSAAATAAEDPFVQQTIGLLAANSFVIDAAIAESARALDRTANAFLANVPEAEIEALLIDSALSTARTQITTGQLALQAAQSMFETGGGSATSRKYNFDRHWRNIRTLLNHNPLNHKARVVGDYLVNGTATHLAEGKVF